MADQARSEPCEMKKARVVISGMSGVYPQAGSVHELSDILYNKVNPISRIDCWGSSHPEILPYHGAAPGLFDFDAQFFRISPYVAANMDPMAAKILEHSFQAVYDAGVAPAQLQGRKVSVYVGSSFSDELQNVMSKTSGRGFTLLGCNKAMFANRISYLFDLKGPSVSVDATCNSSMACLQRAYEDIANGHCEAAIIASAYLHMCPCIFVFSRRTFCMSPDGKTRCFDDKANGFVRSDAINVMFLQKIDNAKRIYAEVVHVANDCGGQVGTDTGVRYGFYRDPLFYSEFLKKFYKDAAVAPQAVEYVEAFGSADPEVDKLELEACADVFCKGKENPLLVGSVMSNIGFSESSSRMTAIVKVALGYHTGKLAANLHCENPRSDVQALKDGSMSIVTEHTEFGRTYAAVNGFSVMGLNSHVLLHGVYKPKDPNRYKSPIPYLVNISARLEEFVPKLIETLKSKPLDSEEIALLHNVHSERIRGDLGRGYVILDKEEEGKTIARSETAAHFDEGRPKLWFVYSGMGSQWVGMGAALMRIPIFAAAIQRCHKVLEPKEIDLVHIITTKDEKIFENILYSVVGIAAIQVGLTDVLAAVGLVPDNVIGHSLGELGCAYADGCFTAEEMVLAAYTRGKVAMETKFIRGAMVAVGLGYSQILPMLPREIDVACHNSATSCTISGPADVVCDFVKQLKAKDIFAKEVASSNIAFHSRYMANAGPGFLQTLQELIKKPKPRTERWISSSVPKNKWEEPEAKLCSPEYHTYNMLNPVLFEEACREIQPTDVLVEIAPHGLLQAILKRSVPASCKNVALTLRGHEDNSLKVLEAIGQLFIHGYDLQIAELYPKVEFPVSTGTPQLAHLVKWYHDENPVCRPRLTKSYHPGACCKFVIVLHEEENAILRDHLIKGKIHYPFSATLCAVWDALAMYLNKPKRQLSVEFSDLRLFAPPLVSERKALVIYVSMLAGSDKFEVMNENRIVASGRVVEATFDLEESETEPQYVSDDKDLKSDDIYKLFCEKDLQYQGDFRSLHQANASLTSAQVVWKNDWMTFLDGVLQLPNLKHDYNYLSQPCIIRKLCIDVNKHTKFLAANEEHAFTVNIVGEDTKNEIRCGGVTMQSVVFKDMPLVENVNVVLKTINNNEVSERVNKGTLNASLQSGTLGDLDTLRWTETIEPSGPGIAVNVHYAALNNLDALRAKGLISRIETGGYGMDFSGVTDSGCRVMGAVINGAAQSRLLAIPELLWPVPDHWTLQEAATVPSAYLLALYCLSKTNFGRDQSLLVSGGAGALGQAVISIALAHGAEVFTTVSDVRKKQFLLRLYPELKEDHIGCSRDDTFVDLVRSLTNGKGVDIVICAVRGKLKDAVLNCAGSHSTIFDVAQIPFHDDFQLGLFQINKKDYLTVDIINLIAEKNDELKSLQTLMCEGIIKGYVRPLTRVTYAPSDVTRAMRLLARSNHRGRVLLRVEEVRDVRQRIVCSKDRSHLVVCVDEFLGAQWAEKLISRGAVHLTLHGQMSGYLRHKIQSWRKKGIQVETSSVPLNDDNIKQLITASNKLAPIEGIYIISSKTKNVKDLNCAIAKLDLASKKMTKTLRYFAIITDETDAALHTCLARKQSSLPATLLKISGHKQVDNANSSDDVLAFRDTVAALERAMCSKQTVFQVKSQPGSKTTLLQEIARITDMTIPEDSPPQSTLLDLGLSLENLPAVQSFLSDVHSASFTTHVLNKITVKEIRQLDDYLSGAGPKEEEGLARFFSDLYLDNDEIVSTTEVVHMPTRATGNLVPLAELDMNETYIYMIPGVEGQHGRFGTMCDGLKIAALVLQPGLELRETGEALVQRLTQYLLTKLGLSNKKDFYILGYEAGVTTALAIAANLEKLGMSGTVFCLGGTPEEVRSLLSKQAAAFDSTEALKAAIASHAVSLLDRRRHSTQYRRDFVMGAVAAMLRGLEPYVPVTLRSRIIIIRASDVPKIEEESSQSMIIHNIQTPLAHLTQDLRCAAIVNSYLRPGDLDAFKDKNICEATLDINKIRYV